MRKYSNAVFATALNILSDFHYAEDIAQDAFFKAWFRLGELKDGDKFGSWLHTLTRRLAIDWVRKNKWKRFESAENVIEFSETETVEDTYILQETRRSVWGALNQLDENHRLAAVLYFISGLNSREISEFVGVSKNTIESRIRRAKLKMKKELFYMAGETLTEHKLGAEFEEKVIKRVLEVACLNLPVSNVEASTQWYVTHLGCTVMRPPQRFDDGNANALIRLGGGGPAVWLRESSDSVKMDFSRNGGNGLTIFELRTENVDEFYEQLGKEGVNVFDRQNSLPCGKYFKVADPDGNTFTVLEF